MFKSQRYHIFFKPMDLVERDWGHLTRFDDISISTDPNARPYPLCQRIIPVLDSRGNSERWLELASLYHCEHGSGEALGQQLQAIGGHALRFRDEQGRAEPVGGLQRLGGGRDDAGHRNT